MKKLILKIISIILAFLLGAGLMGYYMMAGNNELMDSMSEATLPLFSVVLNGQKYNTMHGYLGEMDGQFIRGDVIPLPEDRKLSISADLYGNTVKHLFYEVRSLDHNRLVENTEVEFNVKDGQLEAELPIKDLLDEGQEHALILRVQTGNQKVISYYTRIANIGETRLEECLEFARIWHEATFDKENTVSITQYLEPDSSADNDTLDKVTIHSRYRQIIWDQLEMKPYSEPEIYITEIDPSVTCLRLDYVTQYANEEQETEYYQVQEYFRVRYTDLRMYLLDYHRTVNRIFDESTSIFGDDQLELGILNDAVHYKKNVEENVVAFVQNGELWSYDVARNNLSYVFGFREGWDPRSGFLEHDIRIMNIDESGSMYFMVYGYMNRGNHEGKTGIAVYQYDAVANTVEERIFLESRKPYVVLKEELGDLAYVTNEESMYLYWDGNIYFLDLDTRECRTIAEGLPENCYLLSEDQTFMAWQDGNSLFQAKEIYLLNLSTGGKRVIQAREGEYVQGLGFMGTDFIWGSARQADIRQDLVGNIIFPMYGISIMDETGQTIREFEYGDQGKYVVSVSMEENRIFLECVTKEADDSYTPARPEPITNNSEEQEERILLRTKSRGEKKREYYLSFKNRQDMTEPNKLTPKQVVFEGSRTVVLEEKEPMERYYVYGQGGVAGSYSTVREAIVAADAAMGVVADQDQRIIWRRGNRKTRIQLSAMEARDVKEGENSLLVSLTAILNFERIYPDVGAAMEQGQNAYDILANNLEERILDLSGCELSMVLYYVSQGKPVLALTGPASAVVIVGYDVQNIVLLNPETGEISRMGMNDGREFFQEQGNLFISYVDLN
ncbi:MAG: hypothetical protein HFI33_01710 [Lachnospiraceae bacterium]|nr:hypothetical protein [Lachnospiraceae bacterium]